MVEVSAALGPSRQRWSTRQSAPHLDALRILAAIGIVVLHYSNYVRGSAAGTFLYTYTGHFNLLVDLFFVISGFVIANQYVGRVGNWRLTRRFLWRRLARIYPLHIVTLAFYVAIALMFHFGYARVENPERYALSDIPAQIFLLHAIDGQRLTFNFPSWSLSAEMVCYLAFPLIALIGLRRPRAVIGLAIAAAAVLTTYSVVAASAPWPTWINQGGAWRALPSFLFGVGLYLHRARLAGLAIGGALLPALLGFILVGWALPDLAALLLIYLIVAAAIHCDEARADTALLRLGVGRWAHLTYSSYMLHMPVATVIITLAGRYLARDLPHAAWILVATATVVLAVASAFSYRLFENPLRRMLNAWYDRRLEVDNGPAVATATPSSGVAP